MKRIFLKSMLVAIASVAASVLIAVTVVPAIGGVVDGNAWLMLTVCPLVIAWPSSAYMIWQGERLKTANRELAHAHAQLALTNRKLEEKASRDDMTGLLNRESFFAAIEATRGSNARGALLIIDADHFKRINDGFGHMTGDRALLDIVAAISRAVRQIDVIGRIGGEEFGAFLAGAGDREAAKVAERIRREVEAIRFNASPGRALPLTVSIGGTTCPADATISDVMRIADGRLYEAKNLGRNRAIVQGLSSRAA